MSKILCIFVLSLNILGIISFPKDDWSEGYHKAKGRSWEYDTKIEHPAPKHGYSHKGNDYHSGGYHSKDDGKAWTHVKDSGDKHGGKHYEEPIHFEKPIHIEEPIHFSKPVHFEKPIIFEKPIHFEKPDIPIDIHHEIPINIPPVHTIPIHIPKYNDLGQHYEPPQHHYEPPVHHYEPPKHHYPITKHIVHYEPKKEEHKKDSLSQLTDINVDGIIDDITKDLSKTSNYVS